MGVPAFFRWMSEKYAKCIVNVLEETQQGADPGALDWSRPNPNDIEFDALYLDMNGCAFGCPPTPPRLSHLAPHISLLYFPPIFSTA